MRPILLDTNAYAAFMLGAPEVVEVVAHAEKVFVTGIVLGELLGGFAAGTREPKNRAELARFLDSPRVDVLPVTARTADSYALVYLGLRRKGQPVPTNDLWIAASALEHGAADARRPFLADRRASLRSAPGRLRAVANAAHGSASPTKPLAGRAPNCSACSFETSGTFTTHHGE